MVSIFARQDWACPKFEKIFPETQDHAAQSLFNSITYHTTETQRSWRRPCVGVLICNMSSNFENCLEA